MKSLVGFIRESFNNLNNGDEFYTRLEDIEKELTHYSFKNKIVYCNCDNPEWSNFWKYFKSNFKKLGLKKLLSTYYDDNPKLTVYDGESENKTNIKSGRFQDNLNIIKDYDVDIVVTNPPYSDGMPVELAKSLVNVGVDFIFVGPLHFLISKEGFKLYKDNKINTGYTNINYFTTPSGKQKGAPSAWFTNLDVKHDFIEGIDRDISEYEKYDNYDAIDCNPSSIIPKNYDGKIGVSYRFLTKMNKDQFDVIEYLKPKINGKAVMTKVIIRYK